MRIAYILQMADLSTENGISKKIHQQAEAWRATGAEVGIFAQAHRKELWNRPKNIDVFLFTKTSCWDRFAQSRSLCAAVRAWRPDLIYFRYAYHAPGLPDLFRAIPTIAEINSDDTTEYALTLGFGKRLYHRLTRHRLLTAVSALAPVTRELDRRFASFGHPSLVLANGIRLDDFKPLPAVDVAASPRLVFLGSSGTPWHGLDRIGELAALLQETAVDIIGFDRSEWTSTDAPPGNLVFHGRLTRDRYQPLLQQATIALGTFGLYRKGMHEACPLKVREYLALGLPVIGACADTDISSGADYYLRLPNNDTPLAPHREAIVAFVEHWRGRRVPREAIAHLDTNVKEATRLAFMIKVASEFAKSRHE